MPEKIYLNGSFVDADRPFLTADSRAFRYGDGLFETMRFTSKRLFNADFHFERLMEGMLSMKFDPPGWLTKIYLEQQINDLVAINHHPTARIRLTVFRGNGGINDPVNHFPNCVIQSWKLEKERFQLNENGLVTGIYDGAKKAIDGFSNFKHNNFLPYVMAALHAKSGKWNDAVVLNSHDRVCDTSTANIFVVKNEKIYTPALSEGCVAGTMRRMMIQQLNSLDYQVAETEMAPDFLQQADEIFLTNAIHGMKWVATAGQKKFSNVHCKKIFLEVLAELA